MAKLGLLFETVCEIVTNLFLYNLIIFLGGLRLAHSLDNQQVQPIVQNHQSLQHQSLIIGPWSPWMTCPNFLYPSIVSIT